MSSLEELEARVKKIEARNARVESDKAWETSMTRRMLVAMLTYIVIVLFFVFAGLPDPFINAVVPALAFLLSTLTVGLVKKAWLDTYET